MMLTSGTCYEFGARDLRCDGDDFYVLLYAQDWHVDRDGHEHSSRSGQHVGRTASYPTAAAAIEAAKREYQWQILPAA